MILLSAGERASERTLGLWGTLNSNGRFGNCVTSSNGGNLYFYTEPLNGVPRQPSLRAGFAVRFVDSLVSGPNGFFYDNTQFNFKFFVNADGTVTAKHGNTVLGTSTQAFELDRWYYVEAYIKPGPAGTGRAIIRVDGVDWLDVGNKAMGNVPNGFYAATVLGYSAPVSGSIFIDDAYLITHAEDFDWLGDITVVDLALGNPESNTGWEGSGSGDYQIWKSAAAGQEVVLSLSDLPTGLTGSPVAGMAAMQAVNTGGTSLGFRAETMNSYTNSAVGTTNSWTIVAAPRNPGDLNAATLKLVSW